MSASTPASAGRSAVSTPRGSRRRRWATTCSRRCADEQEWLDLAASGRAAGFDWTGDLAGAAGELAASYDVLDGWEAGIEQLASHRDLTTANVLDRAGEAVLIDWESAGPIGPGSEIGRTALDHGLVEDGRHDELVAFLRGYGEVAGLPPVGPDWCALWIRGLVVFADHCARSCIAGTAPASLLSFQSAVVRSSPAELRRRLAIVPELVERLERAAR